MPEEALIPEFSFLIRHAEAESRNPWTDEEFNSCAMNSEMGTSPAGLSLEVFESKNEEESTILPTTIGVRTYIDLDDTFDDSYKGKKGFIPVVNESESGLLLEENWRLPPGGELYEPLFCRGHKKLQWGWLGTGNTFLGLEAVAGGDTTGGYDTYIGHEAGYYSTTATANVSVGAGSGIFLRTTYTIDPNVDYQFTLRRTGTVSFANSLYKFGDYLITREYHIVPSHHMHFYKSTDGVNWSEWFTIADNCSHYHTYSCVEFLNKFYMNWYNPNPNPRLQIWDGNAVTTAFTSVAQGNYLAGPMIVSGAKLWILTDVTPGTPGRRVAYWTADGTTYNPITDYDGGTDPHASYLYYGKQTYLPAVGGGLLGRFLANRWLEFKDVLYLFASTWNTTNSSWSWQVWQSGTTTFTKIYDSGSLNDGYAISSVVTDGEFVIVTGNTISEGNYDDACRVYRSTNMTNWGIIATLANQGLCYESLEYGNIFYSMFVIQAGTDNYTKLYYWDDENSEYVQCDNSITTEDHYVSGNFLEYKGSFFIGKWMEIYELTRTKSTTITVTDKFASGNTIVGAAAGDMPIAGNINCLYGYNSNLSSSEIENGIAIGAYSRVSRDNTLVLGGTDTYQVDVAIGQTYAIGRLHIHQYGEKEIDTYGLYIDNIATNTTFDGINKYGAYITSTGTFTGSTGTGTKNYGLYLPAVTGADANYGFYSVSNVTTEDQFISTKATGTAPMVVSSETEIDHFNSHLLQGYHASSFLSPKYIVQEVSSDLTAEQSLGTLATGILKNTTTAGVGVLSIAAGTDLPAHVLDSSVHTVSSLTTGHFLKALTASTFGFAAHGLTYSDVGAEPALGNPGTDGWVLSSTILGVRSWIAPGGGGVSAFLDLTDVYEANYTGHAAQFVVVNGAEDGLVFSASSVAGHDILSVSHTDALASAVSAGSLIIGNATPKWAELAAGTEGQILEMGAALPAWGRKITISDSAASGGNDGDIWLEY